MNDPVVVPVIGPCLRSDYSVKSTMLFSSTTHFGITSCESPVQLLYSIRLSQNDHRCPTPENNEHAFVMGADQPKWIVRDIKARSLGESVVERPYEEA